MAIDERQKSMIIPFQEAAMAAKVAERMDQRVKFKDLTAILQRSLGPTHERLSQLANATNGMAQSLTMTDLSVAAINELLIEKGFYTADEFNAKEAEVTQRFVQEVQPSPAQEAAQEAAAVDGKSVERLVEGPDGPCCQVGACTCAHDEAAPSSIITSLHG